MNNSTDNLVNTILESYNSHKLTAKLDEDNMLNKQLIIEVTEKIRKILFPGFFEQGKERSEYIKFHIGEQLEFIQSNLNKQISRALGALEPCADCPKSELKENAMAITKSFMEKIPQIREYLDTDVQAAYDGDPAAYSTD